MQKHIFHITDSDSGQRLDIFLASQTEISRSKIKNYINNGNVTIYDKIIKKPDYNIQVNDEVQLEIHEVKSNTNAIIPKEIPLDIIYEDDDLLVINKQSGLTVHPGIGTFDDTLVNGLAHHFGNNLSGMAGTDRPGIVHRLDRDTTGLMIIAKNDKVHELLARDLADKKIKRSYLALVWGGFGDNVTPSSFSEIRTNIDRSKSNRARRAVCRPPKGKLAITHYRILKEYGFMSLIECMLETGRTHQIRVHMSHIGHSVVGDQVYGNNVKKILNHTSGELKKALENFYRQALHSYKLEFTHPISGEDLKFHTDLPKDLEEIISLL